jgi:hypothetical protein
MQLILYTKPLQYGIDVINEMDPEGLNIIIVVSRNVESQF